jgi:hypothetical protein
MTGGPARFVVVIGAALGIARPMNVESAPQPAPGKPHADPDPSHDGPGDPTQPMRLVAVTDAADFALRPRMLGDDQLIVPLPTERSHLVSVEVGLLVTRQDTGEVMDQQTKTFNWKTQGPTLRFFLPPLPGGDYVAEIRTTATVLTTSGQVRLPDKAQVTFRSEGNAHPTRSHEFKYHFEVHHSKGDTPTLVADERAGFAPELMRLTTVLRNNQVSKLTLDCWASSDGDTDYNMQVSLKRCAWVREQVLQRALNRAATKELIEASHGEDNPPEPEPAGTTAEALREIQQRNRVVILKIYTVD